MNINQFIKTNPKGCIILILDTVGLFICFNLAHNLRVDKWVTSLSTLILLIVTTLICLYLFNTYTVETPNKTIRVISRSSGAIVIAFMITILIGFLIGRDAFIPIYGRTILFLAFSMFIIWAGICRYLFTRYSFKQKQGCWLYIGEAKKAEQFINDFIKHKHSGELQCLLENASMSISSEYEAGSYKEYQTVLEHHWDGVIIDSLGDLPEDIASSLLRKRLAGTKVFTLTEFYSKHWTKVPIFHLGQQWLMDVDGFVLLEDSVNYKLKRVFDMVGAIILSLVCLPVMMVTAIAVRLTSAGPAFYAQIRVGLKGNPYKLYKFRTMFADAENLGPQWASINDPRITGFGRILRRMRLDELPQIYNVLKGEMSFIGPRPERPEFVTKLEKEIPYFDLRHLIKPGITGWAQVMYDYGASQEDSKEKLQYDLFYIKNHSLLLDSIILLKTLKTVISAQGR